MVRLLVAVISIVFASATLVGCGHSVPQAKAGSANAHTAGSSPSATLSASASPDGPSAEDVQRFFAALASENPARLHQVFKLAAPGSIAEAYVKEQYGVTLALQQAGQDTGSATFSHSGSSYKSCESGQRQSKSCVTWSNVEAAGNRIANFTVSGKSLKNRLSVGSGNSRSIGSLGRVKVEAAYQSVQSGALFVVFKLKAGQLPLVVDRIDSAYLTKNGTQVTAADLEGPDKLLPHATGNYYIAFPHVPVGGKLVLNVIDQQNYNNASVTIPTT